MAPNVISRKAMTLFSNQSPQLNELISWQGVWRADKAALIFNQQQITWKQFACSTARIGHYLNQQNIGRDERVVVLMENSSNMVLSFFGVICAGACVVPINISISDEALAIQLKDSEARTIIASKQQAERIDNLIKTNVLLRPPLCLGDGFHNSEWTSLQRIIKDAQLPGTISTNINDSDECNVIYSSGTTGSPKGIVHTHRARLEWAYELSLALKYHSSATTICSLGLYSNISWVSLLANIIVGGCIVIQEKFSAEEFIDLVEQYQVTHCAGVPIQYQRVLSAANFKKEKLASLEMIMSCGSPLNATLIQQLSDNIAGDLIELYGLTEGVITTLSPKDAKTKKQSVGKPLTGTYIAILNEENQLCPPNVTGEIIGRGRILMQGYLNKPEADRAASWQDNSGKVWLRTGDIGYLDDDGFLYLVDRKKDMIISGGQNIYPQDLEKVLLQHKTVNEAAVIGIYSATWGDTPLALVVLSDDQFPLEELRLWANSKLGKQQKISRIEAVKTLPRNPNGKVEKKRLREQYQN